LANPLYIIDSREQRPYAFTGPSEVRVLETGDYSLANLESQVAIERKSIDDLIACLTTERDRFERELQRGRSLDYFALVIEGSLMDLANGNYRSEMSPKAALQSLFAFSIRFRLPIWFAENRAHGQRVTESLLQKYAASVEWRWKQLQKGIANDRREERKRLEQMDRGRPGGVDPGGDEEHGTI